MEFRWYTTKTKREDFTDAEWRNLCTYYIDPQPPMMPFRRLQYRSTNGIWRDIPEVDESGMNSGEGKQYAADSSSKEK